MSGESEERDPLGACLLAALVVVIVAVIVCLARGESL